MVKQRKLSDQASRSRVKRVVLRQMGGYELVSQQHCQ